MLAELGTGRANLSGYYQFARSHSFKNFPLHTSSSKIVLAARRLRMAYAKRLDIQWLRALAAGEVVVCHSDLVTKHFSTYFIQKVTWYEPFVGIGVELFFIVSGYVICMRAPSYGTGGAFILGRIKRLFPMYWIFTTLVVGTYLINPVWQLNKFDPGVLSLAKSYLILPQWGFPVLGVGWTLEYEMVFYWVVALALALFGPSGRTVRVVAWSLVAFGFIGCLQGEQPGFGLWAFHIFSPYMFAFAIGWVLRSVVDATPEARLGAVAALAAVGVASYVMGSGFSDRLLLRIAIAGLIFYAFIAFRSAFRADNALNRLVSKLGDASYSIYLSHWLILSPLGKILGVLQPPPASAGLLRVLGIALSIAIGVWIFAVLEKPIDRWVRQGGYRPELPGRRFAELAWRSIDRRR